MTNPRPMLSVNWAQRVKDFVTNSHLTLLNISSLIIMTFIWYIVYTEGNMLAMYESMALDLDHTFWMSMRKSAIGFVGSLCAMILPLYLMHAKKPGSSGGSLVSRSEMGFMAFLLVVAIAIPIVVYYNIDRALQLLLASKVKDELFVAYQSSVVAWTIIVNLVLDVMLGFMTVVEIARHNATIPGIANANTANAANTARNINNHTTIPVNNGNMNQVPNNNNSNNVNNNSNNTGSRNNNNTANNNNQQNQNTGGGANNSSSN